MMNSSIEMVKEISNDEMMPGITSGSMISRKVESLRFAQIIGRLFQRFVEALEGRGQDRHREGRADQHMSQDDGEGDSGTPDRQQHDQQRHRHDHFRQHQRQHDQTEDGPLAG
jgi:hypothetical protein